MTHRPLDLLTVRRRILSCNSSLFVCASVIIFHFLWNHWAHCGIIEDGVLRVYARGRGQCCGLRCCLCFVSVGPRLPFSDL